ncbi:MAG: hemerythrin family protein [Alphaproteobacteria bacterium]|nr:hemerythrin family protein [Alphaproteobacteria bacterium]
MSVGIRIFDRDHFNLVEDINEIAHAMEGGAPPATIAELMTRLCDETDAHFSREAAFLRQAGFPDVERHVEEHRRLLEEIRTATAGIAAGKGPEDEDLYHFLRHWLIDHVIGFDKDYVLWAKQAPS